MNFFTRHTRAAELEPGLVQIVRVVAVSILILQPLNRRAFGLWFGSAAPLDIYLLLTLPFSLLLLALVWLPWFPRHLGRAFLPLVLACMALPALADKFITLNWFIAPNTQELIALGFVLRLWFIFQIVTFLVAWQYTMRAALVIGIGLSLLDVLLTLPFMRAESALYTFFVGLVGARLIIVVGVSLAVAWLMERQRAQRAELQAANRKLALTATATEQLAISHERNRMARELHDTLAHSLSAVSVQLEAVNALWDVEPNEARKILEQATASTRSGLTEARRALQSLRASPLEDLGLTLALSALAESVATRANLKLELELPPNVDGLQPHIEQAIYRIAQEALENVTRHARATHVRVALAKQNGHVSLTVADDGDGFEMARVNGSPHAREHFGIQGMRERAEMAGGQLSIISAPHEGTRVRLEIGD